MSIKIVQSERRMNGVEENVDEHASVVQKTRLSAESIDVNIIRLGEIAGGR